MRLYTAGPMTGIPHFNYPAFHDAAARLRAAGHTVLSPAERDVEREGVDVSVGNATGCLKLAAEQHGFDRDKAMNDDLLWILTEADGVVMLPGWEASRGARLEREVALQTGRRVFELGELV